MNADELQSTKEESSVPSFQKGSHDDSVYVPSTPHRVSELMNTFGKGSSPSESAIHASPLKLTYQEESPSGKTCRAQDYDFPPRDKKPGQPYYASRVESNQDLDEGDHILYQSSHPPFRMMYRSALVIKSQDTPGKIIMIANFPEGVRRKEVYFDELKNLHKVEYDSCRFQSPKSIERANRRLKMNESCYHALFNNSHFFVSWCKTGREYPLTDILVEISRDPNVTHDAKLAPVLYKRTVHSTKELKPGDHVMLRSQHYLIDSVTGDKTFSAYTLNEEKEVVWQEGLQWRPSVLVINCSEHPCANDMNASILKQAGEELKRKTKWEGSDFFVTAVKCGREHSIDEECIINDDVSLQHCTEITPTEKVHEGDHLEFRDLKNVSHSVLVTKCLDHTQVTIKPPTDEGDVLDLTTYPEVYRVEYSYSLPTEKAIIRGSSKFGLKMVQKYSQDNQSSLFVSWAKTGRELPLSSEIVKRKFKYESLQTTDEIQIADHIVECIDTNRIHYMVTQKSKTSYFTVIFCKAGGIVSEETVDFNCKELYRIANFESCQYLPQHEAIDRARSQIGQWKYSPWDRMLFIMEAKSGGNGNTITVSNFTQVSLKEKLSEGQHLICKGFPNTLHSLIVVEYIDSTKVVVTPPVRGRKELDLTNYSEVYRIEYSDCLSPECTTTAKKISLSLEDFITPRFALENITTASQIQIGDHLIEHVDKSGHKHFIVSGQKKKTVFTTVFCRAGRIHEETIDVSCKQQLYRIVYLQRSQSMLEDDMKRAKSHVNDVGQQRDIQWDQLLIEMQAKSVKTPTSKSQITSFSQLQLGDYIVAESRMGHPRHYIIAFVGVPDLCTAIEYHQGKISQTNLTPPDSGKYPKYYRMNYKPGVCIPAKETVDLALSLIGKKFNRRNFVEFLKTNEENTEDIESSVEQESHDSQCERTQNVNSPASKNEIINSFSQLRLGDHLVKEPVVGVSRHYIITSIASSGNYTAIECFQGRLSKVTHLQQERHSKYYRMNYHPQACVSVDESIRKALLLVDKNFVHFLKTNEEDCDMDEKSVELVTTGVLHNMAAPQHIKPITSIDDIKGGDHIVYSATKPPLRPVYHSGLVLAVNSDGFGEIDLVTTDKRGCVEKKLDLRVAVNLGKVIYQGCSFSQGDAIIRARKDLQFKDKEHYNEECNNSHHFVTRLKTGGENSLAELLRIFIKSTNEDGNPLPLKPVLTKVPIVRVSELKPGDHIFIDSKHCLVKSVDINNNMIELFALDSKKHVTCIEKESILGRGGMYRIDYDLKTHLYDAKQTLRIAEEEFEKGTEWEGSDMFVTMAKCGCGFVVDDRCMMPDVVEMHCTDIVGNTSVDNGGHLLIREELAGGEAKLHSVLVYKFYHQTKIEVMPSLSNSHERRIIDLTKYREKYRVNYSHSLPSLEVNVRAESKAGKDVLDQCSDDCSIFISWAKTGKETKLLTDNLLERSKRLSIIRPISYEMILSPDEIQVGDHLFWDKDKAKSYRLHVMVTESIHENNPTLFKVIYCSKTSFKEKVKCFAKSMGEDTYRVNYPEALPAQLAIKRARSQLGEHNFKPLARLWFVRWAKTGSDEGQEVGFLKNNTRPVTKSRISCFSQLNRGDYLVEEPKMNYYHHYIVLSIESPTQCTVVESWRHNVQRKILSMKRYMIQITVLGIIVSIMKRVFVSHRKYPSKGQWIL